MRQLQRSACPAHWKPNQRSLLMDYSHFDLPGLWFSIYKQVLIQNEKLDKDRLDKSALREVVTSIFIASTQKGITRPRPMTKFHSDIMMLVSSQACVNQTMFFKITQTCKCHSCTHFAGIHPSRQGFSPGFTFNIFHFTLFELNNPELRESNMEILMNYPATSGRGNPAIHLIFD